MRVELLAPDIAPDTLPRAAPAAEEPSAFAQALDGVGALLVGATHAEDAYSNGRGSLQDAVIERARADVALSIATAAAQRSAQAVTSILNMQV